MRFFQIQEKGTRETMFEKLSTITQDLDNLKGKANQKAKLMEGPPVLGYDSRPELASP
jgi:hypothetical protein